MRRLSVVEAGAALKILVVSGLLAVALACNRDSDSQASSLRIRTPDQLKPGSLPYTRGALVLAGTAVPVELAQTRSGNTLGLELRAHGKLVERERYIADGNGFRLQEASGETYDPPLPLLQFPMTVGQSWNWEGKVLSAGSSRPASATVVSSMEKLNAPGGPYDCVVVRVDLEIETGAGEPVKRALRLWFARGQGIVQREFGATSTRQPMAQQR